MKVYILLILSTIIFISCTKNNPEKIQTNLRASSEGQEGKTIDTSGYSKTAYNNCKWEQRTGAGLDIWVQNCIVKGRNLTVNPSETLPGYFIEVDSGSGFVSEKIAIQLFDIKGSESAQNTLNGVKNKLETEGFLPINGVCTFQKDEKKSTSEKRYFTLSGTGATNCGEYGIDHKEKEIRYFELQNKYPGKLIFINQLKEKQLFDEENIKIHP